MPSLTVIDGNNVTQSINTLPNLGQTSSSNSTPVVIANDQSSIPVNIPSVNTTSGGLNVFVLNPSTGAAGSSTVSVSNFPAVQNVSGTIGISNTGFGINNFPSNQNVTVSNPVTSLAVNNFPGNQPITLTNSGVAISGVNLVSGGLSVYVLNQSAGGATSNVAVTNFPALQGISGLIANTGFGINNFPANQIVTLSNTGVTVVNQYTGISTQNINGTVNFSNTGIGINNFPNPYTGIGIQTVNGTISFSNTGINVTNFPSSQTINGTVNFSNTGIGINNFPAVQNVNVQNFPGTQTVAGTVTFSNTGINIGNFPVNYTGIGIQNVSGTVNFSNTGIAITNPITISNGYTGVATQNITGTIQTLRNQIVGYTDSSSICLGVSSIAISGNVNRNGWRIQNVSSGVIWFNEGNVASAGFGSFQIYPGSIYECPNYAVYTGNINVFGTSGYGYTAKSW